MIQVYMITKCMSACHYFNASVCPGGGEEEGEEASNKIEKKLPNLCYSIGSGTASSGP